MSTGRFKKIHERNSLELEETIQEGITHFASKSVDGYKVISLADAYFEKRFRKENPTMVCWYKPRPATSDTQEQLERSKEKLEK